MKRQAQRTISFPLLSLRLTRPILRPAKPPTDPSPWPTPTTPSVVKWKGSSQHTARNRQRQIVRTNGSLADGLADTERDSSDLGDSTSGRRECGGVLKGGHVASVQSVELKMERSASLTLRALTMMAGWNVIRTRIDPC